MLTAPPPDSMVPSREQASVSMLTEVPPMEGASKFEEAYEAFQNCQCRATGADARVDETTATSAVQINKALQAAGLAADEAQGQGLYNTPVSTAHSSSPACSAASRMDLYRRMLWVECAIVASVPTWAPGSTSGNHLQHKFKLKLTCFDVRLLSVQRRHGHGAPAGARSRRRRFCAVSVQVPRQQHRLLSHQEERTEAQSADVTAFS